MGSVARAVKSGRQSAKPIDGANIYECELDRDGCNSLNARIDGSRDSLSGIASGEIPPTAQTMVDAGNSPEK